MKLATNTAASAQSSSEDTHKFQISANGTAFQILSSGLYSNKIAAVLRELSCNAADAHVAAGKASTPIEVFLPTESDPKLVIRDHGPGLSHEQVLSLYTTYFSSNKRDSNAFVGGLGLGSKSPFAYTNAFTVQSIHNHVKRLYSCNIGEDGAPTVTKLHEEPTTAPSGVEVSLLTEPRDRLRFHHEAANVYRWFDVRPLLNTKPEEVVYTDASLFDCPAYTVRGHYSDKTMMAKMGNVAYPLSIADLGIAGDHPLYSICLAIPLVIKSPIGHLQVAASREALQYDPTTKKHALQLLQLAYHDIAKRMLAAMDAPECTTRFLKDAAVVAWVARHLPPYVQASTLASLLDQLGTPAATQAKLALLQPDVAIPSSTGNVSGSNVYWYDLHMATRKNVEAGKVSLGARNGHTVYGSVKLAKREHTCIVVADDKHISEKVSNWRKERDQPSILLISPSGKPNLAAARAHADAIAKEMGGVPVYLLSQLPVTVVKINNAVKRDFVEIDDRPVQVFNLFTGKVTTERFGDVPDSMRYLLVKNTENGSKDVQYFVGDGQSSKASLSLADFERQTPFFAWSRDEANVQWKGPEGCLLVRPVDLTRMKLQDIPLFQPSLLAALAAPDNASLRAAGAQLWESESKAQTWYANHSMSEKASGWIGDMAQLMGSVNKSQKTVLLRSLLEEANEWPLVALRQRQPTNKEAQAYTAYLCLRAFVGTGNGHAMATILPEPYSNKRVQESFVERHPLAASIHTNTVRQWLQKDTTSNAHMEMLLRAMLGI